MSLPDRDAPPTPVDPAPSEVSLLRRMLDHVEEGLCVFDAGHRLLAWNARMVDLMGMGGVPLRPGLTLRELLLEMARRGEFGAVDAQAETERRLALMAQPLVGVEERRRPDGRMIEVRRKPMPDGGFTLVALDVSERHAAELRRTGERLAAQTRVLASTLDSLTQGVLSVASDGRVETWNRRAAELLEVPGALLERRPLLREVIAWQIEQGVFGEVAPADKARWLQAAERQAAGDDAELGQPIHYQRRRRDGRIVDVQVHRAAAGVHVRTYSDVTDSVNAQRALAASEARFRAMADAAPAFICQVDEFGRALWFNQRWLRCIGRTLAQALAEDWSTRIRADDRVRCLQVFGQALARRESFEVEFRVITPDGSEPWVADHGIPHHDAEGRFDGYMVYGWDITARKAAERSLIAACDEAERANRAKSEFLSRMSHELRTPLNAVLGFAQLIERDALGSGQQLLHERARHILRGGRHLLVLINEVLDLARIESGTLPVRLEAVDVEALIESCRRLLEPMARERGVRLQVEPLPVAAADGGKLAALADATRLQQVLLNLLSNAIKYNRGGGQVWLRCGADAATLRIEVVDTGPGLTSAQCERLFQAFERLDADAGAVEGAGIGLALSKALVELMHGRIGVSSRVGAGSTFWLELPRAQPLAAAAAVDGAAPAAALPPRADGRPWRVLYVEDNPVNQLLLESMLATLDGVELRMADHPQQGLALARDWAPDLLLLDIQLPGMSGFELLQRLRQDAQLAEVPAVAVSANAMPEDVQIAREAGFDHYLTKPLALAELQALVRRLLVVRR